MAAKNPRGEALKETRVIEIIPQRHSVLVFDDTKLGDALKAMNASKLTAVPVYHRAEQGHKHSFSGWLNMSTIMFYLAFGKFKDIATAHGAAPLFDPNVKWNDQPVGELIALNPENAKRFEVNASDSVSTLIEPFTKGVHRVVVKRDGGDNPATNELVTQSDLVRWIFHARYAFGETTYTQRVEVADQLVGFFNHKPIVIRDTETAIEGFRKAAIANIHGVGIVDANGVLVGTLSASDLRSLDAEHLRFATLPSIEFVKKFSPASAKPVTATKTDSLRTVMQRMLEHRVHRVWIVDAENKVVGVITMSDIIKACVHGAV